MITGDLFPTFGNAFQSTGNSVVKDTKEYQEQLGYCPQFDPLLDKLSGRETLELFARLRGLQEKSITPLVSQLIALTDLTAHADKKTESFSGGNKRKLSLAIALMANPQILLLDEPTSGVDPAARRRIWTTLSHISQTFGCSIILTSHSMQECEALCQRIAIMVSGKLRCLGSSQHLRAKFGQGYTIAVKFKRSQLTDAAYLESVRSHLEAGIPGVRFTDQHETLWTLRVPDPTVQWSTLFEVMQGTKDKFDLEDYSISDTTLEQIFVGFAREQQTVTRL
jgi:ABC-type multidrug transport system ATPase subunit